MNNGGFSTERVRRPRELPVGTPRMTTMPGYLFSPPTEEKSAGGLKRWPRAYGLRTFLDPRCPTDFVGAFRDNIRAYLGECAEVEEGYRLGGMPVWCTLLVDEKTGAVAPLYAVEECVRGSPRPLCDHCRCAGWSHHLVSKRRYHLIIPSDEDWDREALRPEALELQSHLLHGFIHCSGFGHLVCINGRDGGSHFISGADVMNLWDRLCTALRVREITVEDSSRRKGPMELRLLLSVAHGTTWFGRWGYTFRMGSFGVTQADFQNSVDLLASLDLNHLIEEMGQIGREGEQLLRLVYTYRTLAGTTDLTTLRDLLRFLLGLRRRSGALLHPPRAAAEKRPRPPASTTPPPPVRRRCRAFDAVAADLDTRWPVRRLRMAAQVVVDALEQQPDGMMTRQEVRDWARLTIGDTGLIDFVLKSIGGCIVGNRVVRRTQNPATRVLQFSLDDLPGGGAALDYAVATPSVKSPLAVSTTRIAHPSPGQVERDTLWVYKHVLLRAHPRAAEVVLHSKRWAKAWGLRDDEDDSLRFLCGWIPHEREPTRPAQPPEVLVLPPHATVADLKEEAGRAFRDTYCAMEGFRVAAVEGVAGEEAEPLFGCGAESGAQVWVRGDGADLAGASGGPVYEGGRESWTVTCSCGTRDDDGERMVACDVCEVWQHTRCAGIADGDAVPPMFLCISCRHTILLLRHTGGTTAEAEEEYDYHGFHTCW